MQHISDDMDDLLRNAAENYPLKISGANWDSIAGRLSGEEGKEEVAPVVAMPASKIRYYRYAALLLLILLAYMAAKYAGRTGSTVSNQRAGQTQTAGIKDDKGAAGDNIAKVPTVGESKAAAGSDTTAVAPENSVATVPTNIKKGAAFKIKTHGKGIVDDAVYNNKSSTASSSVASASQGGKKNDVLGSTNSLNPKGTHTTDDDAPGDKAGRHTPPPKNEDVNPDKALLAPAAVTPLKHVAKMKRFYIGAYVAPEYNTVKYQPGSKIGFTLGGLFGYRVSKYVSVEAGIAVGKKYYTSDGKYFNSDVSWVRNWDKILSISGYATLTEFPVTIRYSFKPTKEGNFFVAAGLISYVVHQENYNYMVDKNSMVYSVTKTPVVSTTNFLSNVSISGGYESSLGNLCNFRIEPYYRLPLKGIGIGSLPITSIGLNIGVIKKIK